MLNALTKVHKCNIIYSFTIIMYFVVISLPHLFTTFCSKCSKISSSVVTLALVMWYANIFRIMPMSKIIHLNNVVLTLGYLCSHKHPFITISGGANSTEHTMV